MLSKEERASLDIDGRIYLCYDYLYAISFDRILATHGGSISLLTIDGELICTYDSIYAPTYPCSTYYDEDEQVDVAVYEFIDDVLIFIEEGKKGIMDYNGDIILEADYSEITFNSNLEAELMP